MDVTGERSPVVVAKIAAWEKRHNGPEHQPCLAQECYRAYLARWGLPLGAGQQNHTGEQHEAPQ